jgi:hypothetical protein
MRYASSDGGEVLGKEICTHVRDPATGELMDFKFKKYSDGYIPPVPLRLPRTDAAAGEPPPTSKPPPRRK